jgi:hypothetical protein
MLVDRAIDLSALPDGCVGVHMFGSASTPIADPPHELRPRLPYSRAGPSSPHGCRFVRRVTCAPRGGAGQRLCDLERLAQTL